MVDASPLSWREMVHVASAEGEPGESRAGGLWATDSSLFEVLQALLLLDVDLDLRLADGVDRCISF